MNDKKAKTNADRQKAWRDKRKADGYEMHTVWLDPDVAEHLNKYLDGSEKPQAERTRLINEAVRTMLNR
jgi:hypothetical protein